MKAVIDHELVNMKFASHIKDTRVYREYDIYTDHFLVKTQIIMKAKWNSKEKIKKCYKIYSYSKGVSGNVALID